MKPEIHPQTHQITARCVCGHAIETSSTRPELKADICANCHPFFTGQQKFVDAAGRIEKFERKFKNKK